VRLYLIRHGATEWNLEKRIQGRIDMPLSDAGKAALAGLSIPSGLGVGRWFSSPLRRARDSARLLGIESVEVEAALIEMSWGEWEGLILKPLRRRLGDEMRDNEARGLDFCPPGGESPRQVQDRLRPWLRGIAAEGGDTGAIVHKGIIRCVYALATGWDMRGDSPVDFAWDALHAFELDRAGKVQPGYRSIPLMRSG
jgi:probable phosphoglycerate mutase